MNRRESWREDADNNTDPADDDRQIAKKTKRQLGTRKVAQRSKHNLRCST